MWALIAALLAVAAHFNTLHNPFVFDDIFEIIENPSIGDPADLQRVFTSYRTRPLTNLSYALDFARGGLHPPAYHSTNVLLHTVNVLLLFLVTYRLFERPSTRTARDETEHGSLAAFTAASLFAVHPLLTSAVGYVSARAELLATTWFLASFAVFHGWRSGEGRFSPRVAGLGAGLFALALAAKETAVMLPAVLASSDFLVARHDGGWRRRLLRWHLPFAGAVLLVAAVRVSWYIMREQAAAAAWQPQNLALNLHVLERYLALLCLPVSLSLVPEVAPFTSIVDLRLLRGVAVVAMIGAIVVLGRRRHPLISVGLVWFLLLLVPSAMIVILAPVGQPMAEHRVYLASCGFFMSVSAIIWQSDGLRRRPALTMIGLITLLAVLAAMTIVRNRVWSDPVLLWEDAARKAPSTWMAQYGAAEANRLGGDCASAIAPYRRAISIRPTEVAAHLGLAECMQRLDRPEEALRICREVLKMAPGSIEAAACVGSLSAKPPERQ